MQSLTARNTGLVLCIHDMCVHVTISVRREFICAFDSKNIASIRRGSGDASSSSGMVMWSCSVPETIVSMSLQSSGATLSLNLRLVFVFQSGTVCSVPLSLLATIESLKNSEVYSEPMPERGNALQTCAVVQDRIFWLTQAASSSEHVEAHVPAVTPKKKQKTSHTDAVCSAAVDVSLHMATIRSNVETAQWFSPIREAQAKESGDRMSVKFSHTTPVQSAQLFAQSDVQSAIVCLFGLNHTLRWMKVNTDGAILLDKSVDNCTAVAERDGLLYAYSPASSSTSSTSTLLSWNCVYGVELSRDALKESAAAVHMLASREANSNVLYVVLPEPATRLMRLELPHRAGGGHDAVAQRSLSSLLSSLRQQHYVAHPSIVTSVDADRDQRLSAAAEIVVKRETAEREWRQSTLLAMNAVAVARDGAEEPRGGHYHMHGVRRLGRFFLDLVPDDVTAFLVHFEALLTSAASSSDSTVTSHDWQIFHAVLRSFTFSAVRYSQIVTAVIKLKKLVYPFIT